VLKKIASASALVLALTLLAAPVSRLYAQKSTVPPTTPNTVTGGDPEPNTVTGGDPEPNTVTGGDPEPNEQTAALTVLLPILVTL
jgi:hypothetical protein